MISRILSALADDCADCRTTLRRGKGKVHCPFGDDQTPSFDVQEGNGGTALVFCHKCGKDRHDAHIAALKERGLWGTPVNTGVPFAESREVARYRYEKADGTFAYDIIRYEPKTFRASRTLPEDERILYRLPAVLAAVAAKQTVHLVEGEKDADSLTGIGLVATTSPFGAGKFLERYATDLIAANVVIWADKDEPGRAHARDVAQKLSVAARSVKIIESPVGKDASDAVAAGATSMALQVLADDAPEWTSGERVIWTATEAASEHRDIIAKRIAGDPEYVGWRTGFHSLDKEMRYRAGDFWLIAASTGTGKTAMLTSLQRRAPVPSLLFTLEMSRTQIIDRLLAAEAKVDSWKIATGAIDSEEQERVQQALDRIGQSEMQFVDSTMTTKAIESVIRVARVRFGIRLVLVDYVGLLIGAGDSRYLQVTDIAHDLKRMAKAVDVCIVGASQVNRKGNDRKGEPPHMDEMRDSGVLEEDAAVVLAIGRAEGATEAKLAVRKNRHGLTGFTVPLTFDALHATFVEPSEMRPARLDAREAEMEIPL